MNSARNPMETQRRSRSKKKSLLLSRTHSLEIPCALAWSMASFFLLRFPIGPFGWAYLYTRGRSEGTLLFFLVWMREESQCKVPRQACIWYVRKGSATIGNHSEPIH